MKADTICISKHMHDKRGIACLVLSPSIIDLIYFPKQSDRYDKMPICFKVFLVT